MTSRVAKILLICGLALGLAGPVMGEDIWDPPWDMTLPNQTTQEWQCEGHAFYTGEGMRPIDYDNPYGEPSLTVFGDWAGGWQVAPDGSGTEIPTWHVGPDGGTIEITIENNPHDNLKKLIFWQITSTKSPTPTGSPPTTNPPASSHSTPYSPIQHGNTPWYTYNGLIEIIPNPEKEVITFPDLVECTHIEEIVIKTICIPEPASFTLLALGGILGLGWYGWRRRMS